MHDEKTVARHTINLLTSTIKVDADQSDLFIYYYNVEIDMFVQSR
jgi:hypothetical protein